MTKASRVEVKDNDIGKAIDIGLRNLTRDLKNELISHGASFDLSANISFLLSSNPDMNDPHNVYRAFSYKIVIQKREGKTNDN